MEKISAGTVGILTASETGTVRDGDGRAMQSVSAIIRHGNSFRNLSIAHAEGVGAYRSYLPPVAGNAERVDRCGTKHVGGANRQILEPAVSPIGGSIQYIVRRELIGIGLNCRQDLVAAEYRMLVVQMVIEPADALILIRAQRPAVPDMTAIIILRRSLSESQLHDAQPRLAELPGVNVVVNERRSQGNLPATVARD